MKLIDFCEVFFLVIQHILLRNHQVIKVFMTFSKLENPSLQAGRQVLYMRSEMISDFKTLSNQNLTKTLKGIFFY